MPVVGLTSLADNWNGSVTLSFNAVGFSTTSLQNDNGYEPGITYLSVKMNAQLPSVSESSDTYWVTRGALLLADSFEDVWPEPWNNGVFMETIYKDRPEKIKDGYMTVLKLLQYYNCQAVLESSKTSILTFFRTKNMAHKHLMKRPRALLSDIHNGRSNQYGAPASPKVIEHQLDLIADYVEEHAHNI